MAQILRFACLIGLRPAEVIESVRLLNNNANPHQNSDEGSCYYNPDRQCLEHFRFPQIFLRRTKKAYISFVTPEILQIAKSVNSSSITYNDIRLQCHCKLRIPCDMRFCRKVFATHLHQSGIAAEIVDALQGEHLHLSLQSTTADHR